MYTQRQRREYITYLINRSSQGYTYTHIHNIQVHTSQFVQLCLYIPIHTGERSKARGVDRVANNA